MNEVVVCCVEIQCNRFADDCKATSSRQTRKICGCGVLTLMKGRNTARYYS